MINREAALQQWQAVCQVEGLYGGAGVEVYQHLRLTAAAMALVKENGGGVPNIAGLKDREGFARVMDYVRSRPGNEEVAKQGLRQWHMRLLGMFGKSGMRLKYGLAQNGNKPEMRELCAGDVTRGNVLEMDLSPWITSKYELG